MGRGWAIVGPAPATQRLNAAQADKAEHGSGLRPARYEAAGRVSSISNDRTTSLECYRGDNTTNVVVLYHTGKKADTFFQLVSSTKVNASNYSIK